MSYDITGTVTEDCQAVSAPTISGSFGFACESKQAGINGEYPTACDARTTGINGEYPTDCDARTADVITFSEPSSGFVFENGREVLTGQPRGQDFVFAGDELLSTFGDDSILAFVEDQGVVSIPPQDDDV